MKINKNSETQKKQIEENKSQINLKEDQLTKENNSLI